MPLSEHEQRLLEQMERALHAEDPKFASTMRGGVARRHYRHRILLAVVGFLAGLVVLFAGLLGQLIPLGVAGFVLMLASVWFGVVSWQRLSKPTSEAGPAGRGSEPRKAAKPRRGRFMDRIEERWRRRRDERGGF